MTTQTGPQQPVNTPGQGTPIPTLPPAAGDGLPLSFKWLTGILVVGLLAAISGGVGMIILHGQEIASLNTLAEEIQKDVNRKHIDVKEDMVEIKDTQKEQRIDIRHIRDDIGKILIEMKRSN